MLSRVSVVYFSLVSSSQALSYICFSFSPFSDMTELLSFFFLLSYALNFLRLLFSLCFQNVVQPLLGQVQSAGDRFLVCLCFRMTFPPAFLKDNFPGYRILHVIVLSFHHFPSGLTISEEKPIII